LRQTRPELTLPAPPYPQNLQLILRKQATETQLQHYTFEKFIGSTALGLALIIAATPFARASDAPTDPPSIKQETTECLPQEIGLGDNQDGALLFKSETSGRYTKAPMINTDVVMDIAGPVIRTRLSQTFENTTDEWVEGVYVFPLPENAAVDHLRLVIGGKLIEGKIKERGQAKKIYEQAKSEGKKASLVEQERPNIFTASVANIGPREKIAIQIEYQDKATMKSGIFSTRFPMTVAPRYSPPIQPIQVASATGEPTMAMLDPVLDRARITPPLQNPAEEPVEYMRLPVSMTVNLDAGFPIKNIDSPYHDIQINPIDVDSVQINFKDGPVPANRDFKLEWQAQPSEKPYSAVFQQRVGDDTYLLAMLTPTKPEKTSKNIGPKSHARESIFVIDTSGSMGGGSIEQARASLMMALDHLDPKDTFNIIRFSSDHSSVFTQPKPASDQNIKTARRFVNSLVADGGTNMAPALAEALVLYGSDKERVRQILFITDGAIGNEQMLFALIKDNLKSSRLFPVGIGSAPNSFFMSRAAKFGRGTFVQIGDLNDVKSKMGTLFAALDNPVLTNLNSNIETIGQTFPAQIPDLYEGDPIIVVSKLPTENIPVNFEFSGALAGVKWKDSHQLKNIQPANGLSVLWARQKIADLEESRFDRHSAATIDQAILDTALEHHIVSRLTSLVAVDITPVRPLGEKLAQTQVPTQLPEGWDFAKLVGYSQASLNSPLIPAQPDMQQSGPDLALPNTASPHILMIWFGLLMLLIGMMLFRPQLFTQVFTRARP
jgi:Ca-activated chloride channel family protein